MWKNRLRLGLAAPRQGSKRWIVKWIGRVALAGLVLGGALFVLECGCYVFEVWPSLVDLFPRRLAGAIRMLDLRLYGPPTLYDGGYRYDEELFYILMTGGYHVRTPENVFSYEINSRGLRDDEASCQSPEVIVVGDSVAFGWGVQQHETFSHKLESRTGLRVLNGGVPSYGTVRELKLLRRLDTSRLRHLVIQYSLNDIGENAVFYANGNQLPIGTRDAFSLTVQSVRRDGHRRFLRRVRCLLGLSAHRDETKGTGPSQLSDAELFLNVLDSLDERMVPQTDVIVLIVPGGREEKAGTSAFAARLNQLLARPGRSRPEQRIRVLDAGQMPERCFFFLDPHPNAEGHEWIAERLSERVAP